MRRRLRSFNLTDTNTEWTLSDYLRVGFIQTIVPDSAWREERPLKLTKIAGEYSWQQIKKGFRNLQDHDEKPDIIVLPELTLPKGYQKSLNDLAKGIGSIVIAGLDFVISKNNIIRNKAIVVIPNRWPDIDFKAKFCREVYFGKYSPSEEEEILFNKLNYKPNPDPNMYIFTAGRFGRIGVAICSDFFDIERFVVYRGHIHHMIVISHNKDTNSYYFLAEAISRLVYCNVIICNTGAYGDSVAFCPYKEPHKRNVYRHIGKGLFSTQVVKLPVLKLDNAQRGKDPKRIFKRRPPGYLKRP